MISCSTPKRWPTPITRRCCGWGGGWRLGYVGQMGAGRSYKLMKSFSPEALPEDEQPGMAAPAPLRHEMERQQQLDMILRAVAGLPPKTRAVFILKEVEELETAE